MFIAFVCMYVCIYICMYVPMYACIYFGVCVGVHTLLFCCKEVVTGQLARAGFSLVTTVPQVGWNSGCQAWWHVSLCADPCHWLWTLVLFSCAFLYLSGTDVGLERRDDLWPLEM